MSRALSHTPKNRVSKHRTNRTLLIASSLFLLAAWFGSRMSIDSPGSAAAKGAANSGTRMVAAASNLWQALASETQAKALFEYGGDEHADWHFIPRPRKGVSLDLLSESQRGKLTELLKSGLSEVGYKTVEQIRELESVLALLEGPGRRFPRDPQLYFVSFFGTPADKGKWGWRFEGHHLCLNFTLDGAEITSRTPAFYGSNPSVIEAGPGRTLRVLAEEEDLAREFVTSLDAAHLRACLGKADSVPEEVPSTQKASYDGPYPDGVAVNVLSAPQKDALRRLIATHIEKFAADQAKEEWAAIEESGGIDATHVAWRGSLKKFEPHSYLVHGPSFVINYSNTQNGAAHIHSSYRRRSGDLWLERP